MRLLLAVVLVPAFAAPAVAQMPPEAPDPSIADGSAQAALDAARSTWRAKGSRDYAFRVRLSCFCPPDYTATERIVVRDGRAVRPPARYRRVATVPRQFKRIQEAIDRGVAGLDVAYGGRGRPLRIAIDEARMIQDEEVGYTFTRFRVSRG